MLERCQEEALEEGGGMPQKDMVQHSKGEQSLTSEDTEAHQVLNSTWVPGRNTAHRWAPRVRHCPHPAVATQTECLRLSQQPWLWARLKQQTTTHPREMAFLTLLPLMTLRKEHGRLKVSDPGNDIRAGKGLESQNRCNTGKDLEDHQVQPTSTTTTFTTKPRPQASYTHGFWTLSGMVTPPVLWAISSNALKPLQWKTFS